MRSRTRKAVIIVSVALAVTLGLVPFIVPNERGGDINASASLISAYASFLTLLIALFLLNKFGIEANVLEKQANTVLELIDRIKKLELLMRSVNQSSFLIFKPRWLFSEVGKFEDYKNCQLLFSETYFNALQEVESQMEAIFMPSSIVKAYKPLEIHSLSTKDFTVTDNFLFVGGHRQIGNVFDVCGTSKKEFFGLLNGQEISLKDYSQLWRALLHACRNWLDEHSSLRIDINLDSTMA